MEESYKNPRVVAEIGCNHMGDMNIAKQLVAAAKGAGADVAKFQKRNPRELLTPEQFAAPHPHARNSYGSSYGEHREYLELDIDEHVELAAFCRQIGITYSTSVWDMTSARQIVERINPKYIKIPSACNNHFDLIHYLVTGYEGDLHVSLGMTTEQEYGNLMTVLPPERTVMYHSTSGYPVPFEKLFLADIVKLKQQWPNVGFSGHHLGIAVDIAAYTLGASWIERHFTLDRTWKGTDHAASLEPSGLHKLCRDLKATYTALKPKPEEMDPIELEQREKLKYRQR